MNNYAIIKLSKKFFVLIRYDIATETEVDNAFFSVKCLHNIEIIYPKISVNGYNKILKREHYSKAFFIKEILNEDFSVKTNNKEKTVLVSIYNKKNGILDLSNTWSDLLINFESDDDAILFCETALDGYEPAVLRRKEDE